MVQQVVVTNYLDLHEPCAGDRAMAEVGGISADGDPPAKPDLALEMASHGNLSGRIQLRTTPSGRRQYAHRTGATASLPIPISQIP
jgi:hypothetical protein